jgi:glyoxylase-like metal-dependent hydrolase (beta-lactamase superfamily II)
LNSEHAIPVEPGVAGFIFDSEDSEERGPTEITSDIAYQRLVMVNVVYHGNAGGESGRWVLIDAGIPHMAGRIHKAAARRYGEGVPPSAIVMTHAHFDHAGSLRELAEAWDVPIYAHPLEMPYLDGSAAYPPPDPTVGGGVLASLAGIYPRNPVNVSEWLQLLPEDGTVPEMEGWRWIHTPGHTPGHISLWRGSDRALIAGDAFITTTQESAYAVLTQRPELHGPPMYFTQDWEAARESVARLAELSPDIIVTGHGQAMSGGRIADVLRDLARDFDRIAVPDQGRYLERPARSEDGTAYDVEAAA